MPPHNMAVYTKKSRQNCQLSENLIVTDYSEEAMRSPTSVVE